MPRIPNSNTEDINKVDMQLEDTQAEDTLSNSPSLGIRVNGKDSRVEDIITMAITTITISGERVLFSLSLIRVYY